MPLYNSSEVFVPAKQYGNTIHSDSLDIKKTERDALLCLCLLPITSSSEVSLFKRFISKFITGLPVRPVIKWTFGRRCQKVVTRGREDTRVWCRETMFSQMVSYEFLLHGALHGYFLYPVCVPPEKPTKRCEPEEGYLRCSKRFDHGSHSIIFLLFEFKSVR